MRTNELPAALSESHGQRGLSQVAAGVGREVRAPVLSTFDGAPLEIDFETRPGADADLLVVSDAAGREVMRHEVPSGPQSLQWAGTEAWGVPLPAGDYGFAIASLAGGEEIGRDVVETYGRVREARLEAEGVMLLLECGGLVPVAQVTALREAY